VSADLERDLRALGEELAWPATPDLAAAVTARLDAAPRPARQATAAGGTSAGARRLALRRRPRLVAALAVALLVPAAGALAFPHARDEVLDWLGLGSVEVRRAPELPAGARPAPPDALGAPVSLEEAARRAGFDPVLPPRLGDPREVRERDGVVTVVYDGGIRLAQLRGALDEDLLRKIVTTNRVRAVPEGIFVEGRHVYLYLRPDGTVSEARTTGTTLIAQRGDLLLRLEGVASYEQARALISRSG
jgi:hypothetical protein